MIFLIALLNVFKGSRLLSKLPAYILGYNIYHQYNLRNSREWAQLKPSVTLVTKITVLTWSSWIELSPAHFGIWISLNPWASVAAFDNLMGCLRVCAAGITLVHNGPECLL